MSSILKERTGGGPDVRKKDGDVLPDAHVYADAHVPYDAFCLLPRHPMISPWRAAGKGAAPCLFFYCPQISRPQIQAAAIILC